MVTLQISFEHLLETIDSLPEDQKQVVLQHLKSSSHSGEVTPKLKKRVAGLGEGTIWMSDDFADPLPDELWFGNET